MNKAYKENTEFEQSRDIIAGAIGFAVILASIIIGYELLISPK